MTEQELREKIIETLEKGGRNFLKSKETKVSIYEYYADALIAAGLKFDTVVSHTATFDIMQHEQIRRLEIRVAEAEHRAEVAERALDLCETAYILSLNHRATEGISGQAIASDLGVHKFFMEQAEKELAEERKDD